MNKFFLLIPIILFTTIFLFIVGHEATHIILNDFRFEKTCFLDCPSSQDVTYSNLDQGLFGVPIAGVWLGDNPNELALNEDFADVGGFILVGVVVCVFLLILV